MELVINMKVELLSVQQRQYADTIRTYLVRPVELQGLSYEEIEAAVMEQFQVGNMWHENKLELLRSNHDGSVYTVKIREPYLD